MIIFPEQIHVKIEQIHVDETVNVVLSSTEATTICPTCGTTATHIHSHYSRHLRDLPVSGYPVRLQVMVRRFFCRNPACPHKTFAESFWPLASHYTQHTNRLRATLQHLGLALGAEAGTRVASQLGMAASPSSLLRFLRLLQLPTPTGVVTMIGLDDWAYKRKRRYGTLICDLSTGKPIEMLPDRTVHTVKNWLHEHPEVTIISRDRWSEYATAAQQAAPQARQVADRWHVLHNLTESVSALFPRIRTELKVTTSPMAQHLLSAPQKTRQQQYQELQNLAQQGLSAERIAPLVGLSERTVYRWLTQPQAPSWHRTSRSSSVIDPYQSYLLKRWNEGCRKGSVLCRELKARGYHGSERAVYRYLTYLSAQTSSKQEPHRIQLPLSNKRVTWLLVKPPEDLDEQEQQELGMLRQASATAEQVYHLVQEFGQMVRQHQGDQLDHWLRAANESGLPALQSFASGVQRDYAAVRAGLTLPYSNGLLEGHINRLKLIKRSMYGRANFDLLRLRVLCTS
ncbi:transposase [Dictyobacter vulcani]|uniref:Transposase n=1 Tax=Dictyobacter vulcani TaxID=2607529 RepID=A0A5J4KPX6_9CHLR|nr:ISL3 family transposase [Dictyobacter vulcani]GER89653.1 transposase [Dictyobacter vulcani]